MPFQRLLSYSVFMGDGRFNQVFQHCEMRKEIKVLEDIAHIDALFEDLFLFQLVEFVTLTAVTDVITVNLDKPFVDAFQMVNGAQKRRFTRSGRPEDDRYRSGRDLQRDVIKRFMATKNLLTPVIEICPSGEVCMDGLLY